MGYDFAEKEEIDPLATSSGSSQKSGNDNGDPEIEKKGWRRDNREDTITTMPDLEQGEEMPQLHRTHTLGILKFRATEDDLPTDWWFASTAIPLIAATFAPMANLLSIAALVVPWRNRITNFVDPSLRQSTSVGYTDPHWCYDLNVASLVCGFAGNLFLLFNFTKRVRYIVALPATIILFYFASGILIGITASMNEYRPPKPGVEIYSQGYWHAVIAACLYMINSMILMVNMWGYFLGHYPQHFTLTDEQRNLILQTMMFFIWLGGGGAVFAQIEPTWGFPDALYFCDVTILTIGFGDFFATNDLGRGLVFPYSVGGTIILGLMVSSIHKFAGELSKDNVLRKHVETRRVNTLSRVVTMTDQDKRSEALERSVIGPHGERPSISSPVPNPQIQADLDAMAQKSKQVGFDTPDVAALKREEEEKKEPAPNQFTNSTFRNLTMRNTVKMIANPLSTLRKVRSKNQKAILMREEKDRFDAMRNIQRNASQFKKWYALCISALAFGSLWCFGAIVFWQVEKETQNMTYFKGLYFCYVSLLTIGYGDLSPKSNAGKPFFVVWSLIAVPTMTILISDMGDTVISSFKRGTFRLADFTVLPKAGMWHDILESNPWLLKLVTKRVEKKRKKQGLPVGPADDDEAGPPPPTIEDLVNEDLSEAEMTRKLAFAIRKTADDLSKHAGKKYEYEEWVEFTRLIRFTKMDAEELEYDEEKEGVVEWDWLEESSPMLSQQSESEWILDRLCESLLRQLKKNQSGGTEGNRTSADVFSRGFVFGKADAEDGEDYKHGKTTAHDVPPTETQERRRRASGADALLTFFTGERRGTHAYARDDPIWSKKALDKAKERRKSSVGLERRGPFGRLHHSGKTGAVGGGRGGAGIKKLKVQQAVDD